MFKTLAAAFLFVSVAQAAEITVLDARASSLKSSTAIRTSFQVDVGNGNSGVAIVTSRRTPGPRENGFTYKTKIVEVPELKLEGSTLVAYTNDGSVACGTLGTSSVLKLPVLKLSGDCSIEVRKANGNVKVVIVTK